ncbi:MAG: carbohydrate-binding protein [Paludibacteraceae bacterium]|nr:carbohydrate-binding protein [Paludibacteraceae bacterium]
MKRKIFTLLLAAMPAVFSYSQGVYGCTPDLHVEGNQLTDPNGNSIILHGVMDTPSMWFNSNRWSSWDIGGYVPAAAPRAREYFTKIFDAITATSDGAYCDLFRLHMEPSWLRRDNIGNVDGGESNLAITYDRDKVKLYLEELFVPIAEDANAHGLYVIMRPPGVCPEDIQVGDAYQKYLLDVWDIVSSNPKVKEYAGWLSLELANEPVRVRQADGSRPTDGTWGPANSAAKTDFFQPIVDKIRSNGFTGIIWIPGEGYQSSYESYAKYPIRDNNFGYAVHVYPGWYGNDDNNANAQTFISNFQKQVPGVTSKPVVVTEIDWSPGEIVYDENGQPKKKYDGNYETKNYGTWGTASTSKWGNAFKTMKDHFGNISMNLTSTDDYLDMEYFLKTGIARASFSTKNNPNEACGYACWKWYKDYASKNNITCKEAVQTPFKGTALAIPGKIEAEDFDEGGEGVSYHDEERANNLDSDYRKGYGVDIKDVDGNIRLGYTVKGEWLEYTVNIAETSRYTITSLVSTDNDEASFHFLLDDEVITDEIKATNTGDWNTLVEVKADTKELAAGEHILKLYIDNSFFDIDWFKIEPLDATKVEDIANGLVPAGAYTVSSTLGQKTGVIVIDNSSSVSDQLSSYQSNTILFLQSAETGKVYKVRVK